MTPVFCSGAVLSAEIAGEDTGATAQLVTIILQSLLVDRQVDQTALLVDPKSAGTKPGLADHRSHSKVLSDREQERGATRGTGKDCKKGRLDHISQRFRTAKEEDISGTHLRKRFFTHVPKLLIRRRLAGPNRKARLPRTWESF